MEPENPTPDLTAMFQQILDGQSKINDRLTKLEGQSGTRGPGTIPLPDGVPAPIAPAIPWDEMDDETREAWIRAHTGGTGMRVDTPEWETVMLPGGVGGQFPPPPDELKPEWAREAEVIFENWSIEVKEGWTLTREQCIEAYTEAGPLWLAAYAHKFLMQMPMGMRRVMVRQVTSYAPVSGAELGRDLLRAPTNDAAGFGYEQALGYADQRLDGVVAMPGPGGASE